MFTQRARTIFRDNEVEGDVGTAAHEPRKSELRQWGLEAETALELGIAAAGGIIYTSLASINADLHHDAATQAWVYGDATAANNGIYRKAGASGEGSWSRVADLPYAIIPLAVSGGTANAITATSAIPIPQADRGAILLMTPVSNNTGAVTLALNGGSPLAVVGQDGTALQADYLRAGSIIALVPSGTGYKTLNDFRIEALAIQAAASATAAQGSAASAATQATAAATSAATIAASVSALASLAGVTASFATKAAMDAGAPALAANAIVLVIADETHGGTRGLWQKQSGVMTYLRGLADVVVDARTFGVTGNGTTDDRAALQAALDAVGAAGGGTVYLGPGIYKIGNTLSIPSYTTLEGARGATVLRAPAGSLAGKALSGITVYALVAMTGVVDACIRHLTIDFATNGTDSNGVTIGGAGAAVRSTGCRVEGLRIYGANYHEYLIWSQCADESKIHGNRITGRINMATGVPSTTSVDLAGIEVYGGTGCEIYNNTVDYCGAGIALVQESFVANCDLIGIRCHDNKIDHCYNGIVIANADTKLISRLKVNDNIVTASGNRGIMYGVSAGSLTDDALISSNQVNGAVSAQIALDANGASISASDVKGIVIAGNIVSGGGHSISVSGLPSALIQGNQCRGASSDAVVLYQSGTIEFLGNTIIDAGGSAVDLTSVAGFVAKGNVVRGLVTFGFRSEDSGSSAWRIADNDVEWAGTPGSTLRLVAASNVPSCIAERNIASNAPATLYELGPGSRHDQTENYSVTSTPIADANFPAAFARLNGASGDYSISGIQGGRDGVMKTIRNNSGYTLTVLQNNSGSAVGNRFGAALVLAAYQNATWRFSGPDNQWLLIAVTT